MQVIRNQIVKLQEGMNNERMAREVLQPGPATQAGLMLAVQMLEERKAKEFKLIENSILLDLNVEKQVSDSGRPRGADFNHLSVVSHV